VEYEPVDYIKHHIIKMKSNNNKKIAFLVGERLWLTSKYIKVTSSFKKAKFLFSTFIIIRKCSWAANQHIIMLSGGSC